ncbi:MAG: choice-of-anchor D domain-containing protein, partial [Bryobacteraceae bacterium]|nr:choice-of-anchor D domain-containing protein [Bryobacteraceae bacterium]
NDGGGGTLSDHFKNLVIEYTTTNASTPLPERTWTRVTGLANGFNGTELLVASAVNSDGTVTRDSHNSANSGWASLTFNSVNATGIRIGFNNTTSQTFFNHYKVHEFEAYGSGGGGGTASSSIEVPQRIVDFGVVAVGETADRTINIRNSGAATRNVTGITIDDAQFTRIQPGVPFAIGAGSFQNLQIRFTPRAGGPQNALLTITTDDPARPVVTVIVTGVGRATQQPALGFEPPSLSFLASEAGQTKTVRATNVSSVPLLIVDITSSNPSFVVSLNTISTGGTNAVNVPVRFLPTGPGTHRGTISIVTDPPAPTAQFTVTGEGPPVASSPVRVTITDIAGWPNGRLSNNLPANAIDGSTASFTWTTESFNSVNPSYLGIGFAASTGVNRIRLFKDNDAGGPGLIAKNLVIEYSTSPVSTPLSSRTWTPVTGLTNGFQGAENMVASGVNANGTVLTDNHNSAVHGWASLTFNAVNATAIRIGFSNASPISVNHYRVYEFEAYGPAATQR